MFRSRIAEAYFNKINKNKKIKAQSAGIIKGVVSNSTNKFQFKIAKKLGINVTGKPKGLSVEFLKKMDLVIVVANDIPKSLFDYEKYNGKIIFWDIKDVRAKKPKKIETTIKQIIKKVDSLVKALENKK
jgi:protein-tyrosine-phosphatase